MRRPRSIYGVVSLQFPHQQFIDFLFLLSRVASVGDEVSAIERWLCATSCFLVASMLLCEGSLNISNEVSLGDILDDEPSIRSVSAEFGCRCRVHLKSFISFNAKSLRDLVWYGYSRCNNHRPCVCVCTHGTHDI